MSASRPLSVRSKLNPSLPAVVSVSPTRSPLTMLFPSDEHELVQSREVCEPVVFAPVTRATSGDQQISDDKHLPVMQGVTVEGAEAASEWRSGEDREDGEAFVAANKTQSEQPFALPPFVSRSKAVEVQSEAVGTSSVVVPISSTPSTPADSERRVSSLARTSIRTSPIPLDSIPSVSPIRFHRTRRAPREPAATPFESSFQASDFSEEHEQVVVAGSVSTAVNASIGAEAETGVGKDNGDIFATDKDALVQVEEEKSAPEKVGVVTPKVLSEVLTAENVELHDFGGHQEDIWTVGVVSISSETKGQQILPEEPVPHSLLPSEAVSVHTTRTADKPSVDHLMSVIHEAVPAERHLTTVESVDARSEGFVEKRPVSSRPRFQPRRGSIISKPSGNPVGETPAHIGREDISSVVISAPHAAPIDRIPSARPPSPLLPPSDSPAVKVAKRHMSVTFEQNVIDAAEPSVKETHLQDRIVLAAPPSPPSLPRLSPPQPPTIEIDSSTVARDPADQALPELATEEAMLDNGLDNTVSEETTESRVERVESAEGEIIDTLDELAVPVLEFPPEAQLAKAAELVSSVEGLTVPALEPTGSPMSSPASVQPHHSITQDAEQVSSFEDLMEPVIAQTVSPPSSPESIQPHRRFPQEAEPASPVEDLMVPVMEPMGPPLSSPESVQPHHHFPQETEKASDRMVSVMEPMDPLVSSPESVQPHHRFSISKTRFPQFLQQRLDDSLSSDGASDNEREIFEDFSFLPRETRADSMIEELEYDDEIVEAINHATFSVEKNEDENDDDQSETASAASTMQEASQTFREEVSTVVEIAAVRIDNDQGERPHAASTLPLQTIEMVDVVDSVANEETLESAKVHLAKNQAVASQVEPPVVQHVQEVNLTTPAETIFPSLQVPAISNSNPGQVNNPERPPVHYEGMYAQLAHATSPARHETTSGSHASSTESAHTRDEAHRIRPSSVPLSLTQSMPPLSHTNINNGSVTSATNGADVDIRNIRSFSIDETAGEEVKPFDENTLHDSPCPVPSVSSDADSQPALPVPVGMHGQLAHSSSPVRPVSVPISVSSGNEALTGQTKPLKTSRWSWLKKKST